MLPRMHELRQLTRRGAAVAIFGAIALSAVARAAADAQSPSPAPSGAPANPIASSGARFDLLVLRTALSEAHPSLFRYRSKPEVDAALDRAFAALDHDVTPLEAYGVFSEAIAAIGDGHTRIVPSRPLAASIAAAKRFPLPLLFVRGRAFVRAGSGDIARGTEITAIGGTPMRLQLPLLEFVTAAPAGVISTGGGSGRTCRSTRAQNKSCAATTW